jgi:hypothetical protein
VSDETVKTIDIDKFVPADSVEWIYLEKPDRGLYRNPSTKPGGPATDFGGSDNRGDTLGKSGTTPEADALALHSS